MPKSSAPSDLSTSARRRGAKAPPGNEILAQTLEHVAAILGDELDTLTIERAVLGLFFSGVKLSDGHGGLCFTPIKEIPEAVCCPSSARAMPSSGRLSGRSAREYLEDITGGNILKKALGIATLNALSAACWDRMPEKQYELELGKDAFEEIDIHPEERTVVVGALIPMMKKLMAAKADFHMIVVAGPTASMLPDAFFSRGTTILGGILVTRPDELLAVVSQGGSGYHFFGRSAERLIIRQG